MVSLRTSGNSDNTDSDPYGSKNITAGLSKTCAGNLIAALAV